MAKGQQSNKMVKKPKKDTAPPKPVSPDAVRPTITTVVAPRGKLKNAPTREATAAKSQIRSGWPSHTGHRGAYAKSVPA